MSNINDNKDSIVDSDDTITEEKRAEQEYERVSNEVWKRTKIPLDKGDPMIAIHAINMIAFEEFKTLLIQILKSHEKRTGDINNDIINRFTKAVTDQFEPIQQRLSDKSLQNTLDQMAEQTRQSQEIFKKVTKLHRFLSKWLFINIATSVTSIMVLAILFFYG